VLGIEGDHLMLLQNDKLVAFVEPSNVLDVSPAIAWQRMNIWSFLGGSVALLWALSGAGTARGYRHGAGGGHGDFNGPMLAIPEGQAGAGGYREHDILVVGEDGAENITQYPYGPEFNVVG